MTTINEFLPFADAANANIIPYQDWHNGTTRFSGFVAGIARSNEINRVLAQGANAGYAMAKFIERLLNEDVYVDKPERLVDQFADALNVLSKKTAPIGTVVHYMGSTIPEGFLLCNGASLSRTEYPELFAVIGTKCGSADSAHFNIPNTHHRFLEGTTTLSEIGQYMEAGLPNSWGAFTTLYGMLTSANGAMTVSSQVPTLLEAQPSGGSSYEVLNYSADRGNQIYGASYTVQPLSMRALILIRAY